MSPTRESRSATVAEAWTIGRLLEWTARHLGQKGSESPRLEAEVLLAHALGCKRIELYTRYEEDASDDARQRFRELVKQRIEGCPVAYLVGRKEFYSLELEVSPAVLIPRPDTECLVLECLRLAKPLAEPTILDLGTGSGNIAVAVARQHRGARVTAVDVSADALAVARRNVDRHALGGRVSLVEGDLFAPLPVGCQFDFVLSNPPYITHAELAELASGVRDFEPRLALDGGPDGFAVLDRIFERAGDYLKPGGYLLVEMGAAQAVAGRQRLEARPVLEACRTIPDGSGRPRALIARRRA